MGESLSRDFVVVVSKKDRFFDNILPIRAFTLHRRSATKQRREKVRHVQPDVTPIDKVLRVDLSYTRWKFPAYRTAILQWSLVMSFGVESRCNQEERDRYVEYGFRIVAIISKIRGTLTSAVDCQRLSKWKACTEKAESTRRFAMDENYFSRCRAALCACATLKVGYGGYYNNSVSRIETGSKGKKNEIERLRRGINEEQYHLDALSTKREQLSLEQINDNTNTDDIKNAPARRSCVSPLVLVRR